MLPKLWPVMMSNTATATAVSLVPPLSADERALLGWTASIAAARLRAGELGACEYLDAVLRHEARLAALHGFTSVDAERAREAARAADRCNPAQRAARRLHGLPIAVKDNIDVAGQPTTAGSPVLAGHVPARSASVVAALQAQGAVVVGKNNLHEFALGVTSRNVHYGAVLNPWDLQRSAGGSSGGTAAAVAAHIVPLGLGTDTGGSVRIPAALCGVVGFRPSTGRWGTDGVVPISHTRDTIGPLARSVADCQLVDRIVSEGEDEPEPIERQPAQIRLGVPETTFWRGLSPDLEERARALLDQLVAHGVTLVPCTFDDGSGDLGWLSGLHIALYENLADLRDYWASHGRQFDAEGVAAQVASPDVREVFAELLRTSPQLAAQYQHAMTVRRPAMLAAYRRCLDDHRLDALVFPTTPIPAGRVGEDEAVQWAGSAWPTFPTYTRHATPATVAGVPAVTLPGGTLQGLPWGLELDGRAGADGALLAVAKAIEAALPPMPTCPLFADPTGGRP